MVLLLPSFPVSCVPSLSLPLWVFSLPLFLWDGGGTAEEGEVAWEGDTGGLLGCDLREHQALPACGFFLCRHHVRIVLCTFSSGPGLPPVR